METFDFPFHITRTEYPDSGTRVQLGNSYIFTAPPQGPDQRTFILDFAAMKYFLNNQWEPDETIEPKKNMLALEKFYQRHQTHKSFLYDHPVHGQVTVRFKSPLKPPKGLPGGDGATEGFSVELLEEP